MSLDDRVCGLPLVGGFYKRVYSYFRQHILYTEVLHILFGIGIGLLIFDHQNIIGWALVLLDILGHLWAFFRGRE